MPITLHAEHHVTNCPSCNEPLEPGFDACWRCGRVLENPTAGDVSPDAAAPDAIGSDDTDRVEDVRGSLMTRRGPVVRCEIFRGTLSTWSELFEEAAAFASQVGRDQLITISHSEDKHDGVVAVWYWDDAATESADTR